MNYIGQYSRVHVGCEGFGKSGIFWFQFQDLESHGIVLKSIEILSSLYINGNSQKCRAIADEIYDLKRMRKCFQTDPDFTPQQSKQNCKI
jgi:hypothetical protein